MPLFSHEDRAISIIQWKNWKKEVRGRKPDEHHFSWRLRVKDGRNYEPDLRWSFGPWKDKMNFLSTLFKEKQHNKIARLAELMRTCWLRKTEVVYLWSVALFSIAYRKMNNWLMQPWLDQIPSGLTRAHHSRKLDYWQVMMPMESLATMKWFSCEDLWLLHRGSKTDSYQ